MNIINFFKQKGSKILKTSSWKELGRYNSIFSSFGDDIWKAEVVRSCIRPIAEHTSKANAKCEHKNIEKLLQFNPNNYMNGKDFLYKVRTILEVKNTAFIYIDRDECNKIRGFYPVNYKSFEVLDYNNEIYIKFTFQSGKYTLPWLDLAVLRKDYYSSDIVGDDNTTLLETLDLISTTNQGVANAIKSTSNLRGIIKTTKSMLKPEDAKKMKDQFVEDYLVSSNTGGLASLDSTMDFIPVESKPLTATYAQIKEFRENVYRHYGINDNIIMSNFTEGQMEAFYDAKIEPFLVALGLELTNKCFSSRERGYGVQIVFESNRIQYASMQSKMAMVQLVDRGALTPNEWRQMFNLAPVDGGNEPIRRLDTAVVKEEKKEIDETKEGDEGNESNG